VAACILSAHYRRRVGGESAQNRRSLMPRPTVPGAFEYLFGPTTATPSRSAHEIRQTEISGWNGLGLS
jgi:hypothetical protein